MKIFTLTSIIVMLSLGLSAQEVGTTYEPIVSQSTYFDVSEPLIEVDIPPRGGRFHHLHKKDPSIPRLNHETHFNNLENALPKGDDPAWQKEHGSRIATQPIQNFEGVSNTDNGGYFDYVAPPDTDGDVGPNHYFHMANTIFEIYDKSGNSLLGPSDNSTIWDGFVGDWTGTNDGDPIVLYDEQADRWLVSQFAVDTDVTGGTYWILVAISTTADPTGSYYRYAFEYDEYPDYPKFGIWRDGYYLMVQHGNGTATASVLNRSQMIAGTSPAQRVDFSIPNLPGGGFTSVLPADNDGTWAPVGAPNYFVYFSDDAWGDDPVDRLKIWEFDVNWTWTFLSSMTLVQNLNTDAFSSAFGGHNEGIIPQPGTTRKLAVVEKAMMYRLQYRNFGSYQSMVCCHTVDVNGANRAGIRWYELRKTSGDWYIYQQGTYAPGGTDNFWMASIAQNGSGDIALGYSVSSETTNPSIRYTGRMLGDPLGEMTMGEGVIMNGEDSQEGTSRWGDYSMMSVDPSDDETFWYTNEYNDDYTTWGNWITQIGSFQITDLCGASGGCDEHISLVQIGNTINNFSGCDGYANYTNLSADLPLNASLSVSVTNGVTTWSQDECGIWVDWNEDDDFDDANEAISVSGSPGVGPYTATLEAPAGTSIGEKTMRVRIVYNQTPEPCGTTSYGEVEDYTINVTTATPNVWTGAVNRYWHNAGNWSLGHIPTDADPVEIPDVGWQPATVDDYLTTPNEACKSLIVETGAGLRFYNQELIVEDNALIYGDVIMDQQDGNLTVLGDLIWYSGSSLDVNHNLTFINVYGNWDARSGSDLNPEMGFVDFKGSTNGYIRSYDANNTFYNLRIYKTGGAELGLSAFSTQPLRVDNLIFVTTGALFNCYTSADVIVKGSFNFYGTFDMTGNNNTSSFIFDGANPALNNYETGGGVFNNVVFSASEQAVAYTDFDVANDLTIEQGVFNANGHTVTLAGDWTNSIGPDGFDETDSRVIFNGPGHQYVYGDEHFDILEVNNGAALRLNSASYDVSCNTYDWTTGGIDIVAGNFTANDLADSGLWGTWWCNPNGTITVTQDNSQFVDLNGEIHIFGGTMTVNGGSGSSWWPYVNNAVIQMTGGTLDFVDAPIRVSNTSYTLTENITGGTIKCQGSFWDYRGDFTPEGGTVELYGQNDAQLLLEEGSNLYNLTINKQPADNSTQPGNNHIEYRDGFKAPINRANTVTASDTLVITNDFNLDAGTFIAPDLIIIGGEDGGDWNNNMGPDAFVEGEGTVQFVGEFIQWVSTENFNILEMNKPNGDFQIWYGNVVECQTLKWLSTNNGEFYLNDGTLTAWDLFDSGVYGKYFLIHENSFVNLYQDGSQWTDLNAEIRIDNGTMNVIGGSGASFWPYSADAELTMSNGTLNFMDNGIYLNGNSSFDFIVHITGGTIQTNSSFTGDGDDFQPDGGTCELIDESDVFVGIDGAGYFHDLVINKETPAKNLISYQATPSKGQVNAPEREQPMIPESRANTASAMSDFTISNDLIIENGTFDINGFQVTVGNDVQIYGTLAMTDPLGDLTAYFIEWFAGSEDNITAGTFHADNWRFNEGTNAMIGVGNTAYVENLYYSLDDNAEFGNLVAQPFSKLLLNPDSRAYYPTLVTGDFTIMSGAGWSFTQPDAGLLVNGDAMIEEGASLSFSNNEFVVDGNITIAGTLDVSIEALALVHGEIAWPETGELYINSNAEVIFDAPNHPDKGWEYINGHLALSEGLFEITHNSTNFGATATTNVSGGTIRTGGAFAAIDANVFEPTGGVVEIIGTLPDKAIYCHGGNYFHDLLINREPGIDCVLMYGEALTVKNDLTIASGILNTQTSAMFVGGNWTNNVGPDGFVENENEVWFYGETYSHINTDETFYDLYIFDMLTDAPDNSGRFVEETYIEDGVSVNVLNDCRFLGGSLNLGSNSVLDVDNNFIFNGGQCIVPDGTPAEIYVGGFYTNYNPGQAFFPGNSTFTFDGFADQEITTDFLTVYFYNLNIDNPGNLVKFYLNTHVYGDVHVMNGTYINVGIFDHVNTFEGDINVEPTGAFLPKGTINFEGNGNTIFNDQSSSTSYLWGQVNVNKATENQQVMIADDMFILNGYSIDVLRGEVDQNGGVLRCTENVTIHDGGKIIVNSGAKLETGDGANLTVQSGGVLEIIGEPGSPSIIKAWNGQVGNRFNFIVQAGGFISASNAVFEYLAGGYGVNVMEGATVDPSHSFDFCEFRYGESDGFTTFLTINNDQVLTITGASFPDASCDFNVGKDLNQGHLTFVDFTGDFSGEDFDYDPNNLIDWYEPTLEANPMIINVGSEAGTTDFDVISNLDWTASESSGWFSIAPTFGTGDALVTVTFAENISVIPRSGEITLSAPVVPDVVVTVNQEGADNIISISPPSRVVPAEAGTTTFDVEANPGWTWNVTESTSWFSVSPMSGSGNATLTVTYDENPDVSSRQGSINLPGGVSAILKQSGADIYFSVTPDEQNVGAASGSTIFNVTTNTSWTVSESVGWFSVSPGFGIGDGVITVDYDENMSTTPRSGQVTVTGTGASDINVTVNQAGADTYLTVSPANHDVGPDTGFVTFSILSNIDWLITESADWITVLPTSGSGDGLFDVDYGQNATGLPRSSEITVTQNGGGISQTVTVSQSSYPTHSIILPAGWAGLSSYLQPADNNLDEVFSSLLGNLVIAQTLSGIYYPDGPVNTIGAWWSQSAYGVKMDASATLTIVGPEESNKTLFLPVGWSMLPVIANYPVAASSVLAGLDFAIVKSLAGLGIYWPAMNINTLGNLNPGLAYYILVNSAGSVTYPPNTDNIPQFEYPDYKIPESPWNAFNFTASSHLVAFEAKGLKGISQGDIIGVFTPDGICNGITEISDPLQNFAISVYADDPYSQSIDGFVEGEQLSFKIYRPQTDEIYKVDVLFDPQQPNTSLFSNNGISVVTGMKVSSVGINQLNADKISLYPNPTDGNVKASGIEGFSIVEIYNAAGKLEQHVEIEFSKEINLDLTDLPSGVYQLRFTGNQNAVVKKLIRK